MNEAVQLPIDVTRIQQLLPHRYPFLLVDRVVEFGAHKRIVAHKNVTINEPYFQGHCPGPVSYTHLDVYKRQTLNYLPCAYPLP